MQKQSIHGLVDEDGGERGGEEVEHQYYRLNGDEVQPGEVDDIDMPTLLCINFW